jgi:HEAT repeat protein
MSADSMAEQVDRELLYEILYTLKEGRDDERHRAVKDKIPRLRDKQRARDEILKLLTYGDGEKSAWTDATYYEVRSWATTALVELCGKDDKVARQVGSQLSRETHCVPRYWMLLRLYQMGSRKTIEGVVRDIAKLPDPDAVLSIEDLVKPPNERAGPLALTILASWEDGGAIRALETILRYRDLQKFDMVWWACRALQEVRCRAVLELLGQLTEEPGMWLSIRDMAVVAIGRIESPAAARVLARLLTGKSDANTKESAINGLESLAKNPHVRAMLQQLQEAGQSEYTIADSLMTALLDGNAQVRKRAAQALPWFMLDPGAEDDAKRYEKAKASARVEASRRVVEELVRERADPEKEVPLLVDALREIDPPEAEAAALALREYMDNEDVSVRQQAEYALKLVGGERAVQTLLQQKSEVLNAYNKLLAKADEPIQDLFQETMRQAQHSFSISQGMSITIFVVGLIALLAGLFVAFTAGQVGIQFVFGAGTSAVAVIAVLLDMFFRDPHKRVQEATSMLLRTKVIFLGYVRQIHQIDATFKHEFIEGGREFGAENVQQTIKQIDEVIQNTMAVLTLHLPVPKDEKLATDQVLKTWQDRLEAALKATQGEAQPSTEEG